MEKRLVDLEIRYTHLERQLDELNQVVFAQQKQIDRMNLDLLALRSRIGGWEEHAPHETPPHY